MRLISSATVLGGKLSVCHFAFAARAAGYMRRMIEKHSDVGINPRLWQATGLLGRRKKIEGFPEAPGANDAPRHISSVMPSGPPHICV